MSRPPRILDPGRSLLLVVDLQEAYRGKLHEEERTVRGARRLVRAAEVLGVPVVLTEQYPKGLGATRSEIAEVLPGSTARFEKTVFSSLGAEGAAEHVRESGREQVVVVGIETHVCVSQSVHDLLHAGLQAHVVRDAVTARFPLEDEAGWSKMLAAGALPASSESVLFEWLRDARHPDFKRIHALVV